MSLELEEVIVKGYSICRGIAIGKPFFLNRDNLAIFETKIATSKIQHEIDRYRQALLNSQEDIKRLQKQLEIEAATDGITILEAQLEMLQDPLLTTEIEKEIKKQKRNVEFIFQQALIEYQKRFQAIADPFFVERFQDFQDLARRIFSYLNESDNQSLENIPPNSIVCAYELTASDTASAHGFSVSAFVTEIGGPTSHTAIIAKAKGIPCVANVSLHVLKENALDLLIVDGRTGKVIVNPSKETLGEYELLREKMRDQFSVLEKVTKWPAETYDGYSLRLHANLDIIRNLEEVHTLGGQGIGLFRSEYIFLPKSDPPSEDEQCTIYRTLIEGMKGLPVVIRTFDVGGDKPLRKEKLLQNGHLSLLNGRATRSLLKEKTVLKTQLRALLRASIQGRVSILFPMISTLDELRQAKKLLQEAREELRLFHPIKIGCMIEVPSAALVVDHFVKECDFLSIGTNDLIQYSLALDRSEHALHDFHEPTDPSLIRLIKLVTSESNRAKIPVSVCGEIASDPRFTALLIGLGVQELSVAPRYLPIIKNAIRRTSLIDAVQLSERVLGMTTAEEVLKLIVQDYHKNVPEDLFYNFIY